jgi:hypothetical protein
LLVLGLVDGKRTVRAFWRWPGFWSWTMALYLIPTLAGPRSPALACLGRLWEITWSGVDGVRRIPHNGFCKELQLRGGRMTVEVLDRNLELYQD